VSGALPLITGYALLPRNAEPASLTLDTDTMQLRAVLRHGDEQFTITVLDHDVELLRGQPSVEDAAGDELGDPGFIVAE
jgi:hypothetical protein